MSLQAIYHQIEYHQQSRKRKSNNNMNQKEWHLENQE